MKKWLFGIARIVFALGIAALGLSLSGITFRDRVVVSTEAAASWGIKLTAPRAFPVDTGDLDDIDALIEVVIDDDDGKTHRQSIPVRQLGVGEKDCQPKPGIVRLLRHSDRGKLLFALLVILPLYPIGAIRWWLLMRGRGIEVTAWRAFRLAMVGNFFNFCLPGTTGGDLVKAYYAARRSDRRADTLMSIIVDRVIGLLGMVIFAGAAGLFMLGDPVVRKVTGAIGVGLLAAIIGGAIYFTPRLRRRLGFEWLLLRLPGRNLFSRIDAAAIAYRNHLGVLFAALGLSIVIHMSLATATAVSAYALGMKIHFGVLLNVVPILFMASAVPLAYQGMGLREPLATGLILNPPLATANHIVGMLLLVTVYQVIYALFGALFLLKGDIHMHPEEATERRSDVAT